MLPNPALINRSRIQIQNEQVYTLYRRLYWYICQDFLHKEDYAIDLGVLIGQINTAISTHLHPLDLATETTFPAIPLTPIAPNPESIEFMISGAIPVMALKYIMVSGGFDEHEAALIAGGHIVGNVTNPSPVYTFTCRQPEMLMPDFAGTAAADIALSGAILTGEAGQPFTIDTIGQVLETALG